METVTSKFCKMLAAEYGEKLVARRDVGKISMQVLLLLVPVSLLTLLSCSGAHILRRALTKRQGLQHQGKSYVLRGVPGTVIFAPLPNLGSRLWLGMQSSFCGQILFRGVQSGMSCIFLSVNTAIID